MLGMAIGGLLAARWTQRIRNPARAFAFAEIDRIGPLGLRGTALVAGGLNGLAAAAAMRKPASPAAVAAPVRSTYASPKRLLCAAAAAGGLALALEVIWFRLLILYAPGSDTTFALMLTVVLLGIAIGGMLAPRLARLQLVWVTAGGSLAVVAGYMLAGWVFSGGKPDLIHYAVPLMLPAAILSGSLFALLGAELRADSHNPQPAIGVLTTANTLGAALGAALAGLVLLPRLGIEWSLFLLAAGYALLPLLLAKPAKAALPLAAAAAGLLLLPFVRIDVHLAEAAFLYQLSINARALPVTKGAWTTVPLLN